MSKAENLASLLNASGLIDSDDLASGSISSAKLADSSITNTKYGGTISVDGSGNATISGDATITGNIDATKVTLDSATISGSITGGSIVSSGDITASSGSITDDRGTVREFGQDSSGTPLIEDTSYTIPSGSSGKCIRFASTVSTVTVDANNFNRGDVVTLVNQANSTTTINFTNWTNSANIGGFVTNYNGVNPGPTLQVFGVCTVIAISPTRVIVTGNLTV